MEIYIITYELAFIRPIFLNTEGCKLKKKLHGLSPRVNYTDRGTTACQRS
jgi:hypothetical protein